MIIIDNDEVNQLLVAAKAISNVAPTIIYSLLDLTYLSEPASEQLVKELCVKAQNNHCAAVCIPPQCIRQVKKQLENTAVRTVTVANFPEGNSELDPVCENIMTAIADGADEIDVVLPYTAYLEKKRSYCCDYIARCKDACGTIPLKVILETGALTDLQLIADASSDAITAGADFLKTSTGKIAVGATPEAAAVMLLVIKHHDSRVGFKASGGIRTLEQASLYYHLAQQICGPDWVNPNAFRLGTSCLPA